MMKVSLLVVVLALACVCASAQSFSYCGDVGTGAITVSAITLSPNPPVGGTDETVTLTGTVNQQVLNSTVTLTISYNGFGFPLQVFPLGTQVNVFNVCDHSDCPQGPGAITAEIVIPGDSVLNLIPGPYTSTATVSDGSGIVLTCVNVDFTA